MAFYILLSSDEVSKAIRLCLKRCELDKLVSLVEIARDSLKRRVVMNRIYDQQYVTPNCVIFPWRNQVNAVRVVPYT